MLVKKMFAFAFLLCFSIAGSIAQGIVVKNNSKSKTIAFGNQKLKLILNYSGKAAITALEVNGQKVIDAAAGIYSEVRTAKATYSSNRTVSPPIVSSNANSVTVGNITYGNKEVMIHENWNFLIKKDDIIFTVNRTFSKDVSMEEVSFPSFNFININTWEGAYQDYGGLAWFYLFNERLCTYGVHAHSSRFWNSKTGNGLKVAVDAPGRNIAMKYSRTKDDKLAYAVTISEKEMIPRFDSGTNRKRFIRQRSDVWSGFNVTAGTTSQKITLSYFDFNKEFGRGKFVGLQGEQVGSVLNTIARIGVIDKQHFGGNSWHTPYGPICLHEQYIAQMGLAINDNTYLKGYQESLDYYRDNAIKPDGRVWARWAYNNVDIMAGQVTDKGFYEAQWGFLMDSNPDFVTNVAELFDQTGDRVWVKKHQASCEKALDWILRRDSNNNGLVEMMTDSHKEKRGSDWIDIIWAAYENALVNAKLYHALVKWSAIERLLGNAIKATQYEAFANKLKTSFNKSIAQGGFWDEEKKCYVHWLDKDKSVHGRNMVTPVNFMAIAYGICDDPSRTKTILDNIEKQMQKEKLFFWPITMSSFAEGEGRETQYPFPSYENGDIFLSWGSVAVKAYADYKPELAVKYVQNVLDRHTQDGLAYQRYGREKQDGLGDDILSGNSLAIVGLYQAIYGINPLYNRFYLNPHITPELAGTELIYNYQGQKLTIGLNMNRFSVANHKFKISAKEAFGFNSTGSRLSYFLGNDATASLVAQTQGNTSLTLDIKSWGEEEMSWMQSSASNTKSRLLYTIKHVSPDTYYSIHSKSSMFRIKSNTVGTIVFNHTISRKGDEIKITKT